MATKKIKLCTNDVWKDIKSSVKPKCLTDLTIKFNITLEVDDNLYDLIEDDAYLADKIFKHVSKEYKLAKANLAIAVEGYDEQAVGSEKNFKDAKAGCERYITNRLDAATDEIEKNAKAEIDKMLKARKDRTKYRIVFAKDITIGVAGTVMSTLSIASSATGNIAGLILGIFGLLKNLKSLFSTIVSFLEDIVETAKTLDEELQTVLKRYAKEIAEKKSSAKVATLEIGSAIFEEVFGFELFTTITSVKKTHGTFLSKLAETLAKASDLGKKLNQTLDKQQDLLKELDSLEKQAAANNDSKFEAKIKKATKNIEGSAAAVIKSIDLIGKIDKKINQAEKDAKKFKVKLDTIEKIKGRNLEIAEKIISTVIGLGADFGTSLAGAGSLVKLGEEMVKAEGIIDLALTAVETVDKLISD